MGIADGKISGILRHEVLERATSHCTLCGMPAEETALAVDHMIPGHTGGTDDLSGFQALCCSCNARKYDRDDGDFRRIVRSDRNREQGCTFCEMPQERIVSENELCYAIRDLYPVTERHTLVIPKRHVSDYFDLYQPERNAVHALLEQQRALIQEIDKSVTGFNAGVNSGPDAGQTIMHCHIHLIPRRKGDMDDPCGGVRGVIPGKQSYGVQGGGDR